MQGIRINQLFEIDFRRLIRINESYEEIRKFEEISQEISEAPEKFKFQVSTNFSSRLKVV